MQDFIETHNLKRYVLIENKNSNFHLNKSLISAKVDIEIKKTYISLIQGSVFLKNGTALKNLLVKLEYSLNNKEFSHSTLTNRYGSYIFKIEKFVPETFVISVYQSYKES